MNIVDKLDEKKSIKKIQFSLDFIMSVPGFEPGTTWLKVKCSTDWATHPSFLIIYAIRYALDRNRTSDTRIFSPLLYQLSYQGTSVLVLQTLHKIAGAGFEPATFGLWARRASRLLHPATIINLYDTGKLKISDCFLWVGEGGFEPPKAQLTDLQSAPFGHSGIPPYRLYT